MALRKINHLDFYVEDLEKTREHFTKLGFKFLRYTEHGGKVVEMTMPGSDILFEFHQITEDYKTAKISERPDLGHVASDRRPYLDHIAFEVDDLGKTYEELKSKGIPFRKTPSVNPVNKRKLVDTCDAEGHRWVQLIEVKPK